MAQAMLSTPEGRRALAWGRTSLHNKENINICNQPHTDEEGTFVGDGSVSHRGSNSSQQCPSWPSTSRPSGPPTVSLPATVTGSGPSMPVVARTSAKPSQCTRFTPSASEMRKRFPRKRKAPTLSAKDKKAQKQSLDNGIAQAKLAMLQRQAKRSR